MFAVFFFTLFDVHLVPAENKSVQPAVASGMACHSELNVVRFSPVSGLMPSHMYSRPFFEAVPFTCWCEAVKCFVAHVCEQVDAIFFGVDDIYDGALLAHFFYYDFLKF